MSTLFGSAGLFGSLFEAGTLGTIAGGVVIPPPPTQPDGQLDFSDPDQSGHLANL